MTDASILWWTASLSGLAIIVAPITALWVQRRGDDARALRQRREQIFRALWVNRRRPFYLPRVDALNMIDVEFFGEPKVIDAWADLFAHYRDNHPGLSEEQIAQEREDKFATLLYEISQVLGYEFGKTHIRDNIYRPQLHGKFDEIEMETRNRVLDLLRSDALPVRFIKDVQVNETTTTPEPEAQVPPT